MNNYIDLFCKARDYLNENLQQTMETFMCGTYDAFSAHQIITQTGHIINKDIQIKFPNLPEQYIPKCKFKIYPGDHTVECGIQSYFNTDLQLIFLGNVEIDSVSHDLYCKRSIDHRFDYFFIAKYGHQDDMKHEGSKTAAAEYMLGMSTPLSIAFQFAVREGYVS